MLAALLGYPGFAVDEATPLRIRQGVKPSYQNYQLKVRAAATPNMTVIVSAGFCFIDNHDVGGFGTYICVNDADYTVNIAPAGGAGQYRKDTIVASVYDSETAGSTNEFRIEAIQGPYAASAGATVRGTLPPNAQVLADISVAPSQTSVSSANITDVRNFAVAAGGVLPVASNVAPPRPHPGQMFYYTDTDEVWVGKADGTLRVITPDPAMMVVTGAPNLGSSASTYSALAFNAKVASSGATSWSSGTNPSRITASKSGTYSVSGGINWPAGLGSADGRAEVRVNGASTQLVRFNTERGSSGNCISVCAGYLVLNSGDYVEIYANQNSGTTLALTTQFGLHRVSGATS
ncbi:hypothetical protein ACFW08_20295 [Streptomyces sp. NPDC058960]|uniref:hypothetical protein n=1 Tax=Streptomyces sp. NPDC058960 TaxID=3346679 RepID=UPI003691481B